MTTFTGLGISMAGLALWLFGAAPGVAEAASPVPALPSSASQSEAPAPPASREEAREMVAALSDEDARRLLLDYLDRTLPAAGEEPTPAKPWLLSSSAVAIERFRTLVDGVDTMDEESRRLTTVVGGDGRFPWLGFFGAVLACLVAGALVERFMLRREGILGSLEGVGSVPAGESLRPGRLVISATARALGALVFLFGALVALHVVPGMTDAGRTLASAAIWLVGGTRAVAVGIRALLLPAGGDSPWPISPPVAQALARHLSIVAAMTLLRLLDTDVLAAIGARTHFITTVVLFDSVLLVLSIIVAAFAVRRAMGPVPASSGVKTVWQLLAERWHLLVAVYVATVLVLAVYARLATGESMLIRGLGSLSLVLVVPVLDYALRMLAERLAPAPISSTSTPEAPWTEGGHPDLDSPDGAVMEARGDALAPAPSAGASVASLATGDTTEQADAGAPVPGAPSHIQDALVRNFRLLLGLAVITLLGEIWHIRFFDLVEAALGARFAGALLEIGIAGLFAFIVWQIVKAALMVHAVPETEGFDLGGDGGAAGRTRVQTLMPLIAKTIAVVLAVMLVMIGLSAFGVNIGPLLAGAGVIGLAVGFGAQTLVRDIVSGVFFLVDDAFRMGEYLQIGNIRGTVEKISVRSLRLRHHRGPLHTLPYGEIASMTNYSRDYAIMKFEVRVPFETDVEKVRKLIKQVGAELAENEEYASVMLEPLKSQGVNRMDDSAFVIRCKFTTIPGKQFTVRRVAYAKIQEAFAREGIHFAPKRVVVETVAPAGSKEALLAAAAAAEAAEDVPRRASGDDR
jgi:small-conductance mechanosensitive channel